MVFSRGPDAISPTAHYTAEVWRRNGLSDDALGTLEGRLLYAGLWPLLTTADIAGLGTLEASLLARHRLIDGLLAAEIESGRVGQVVEIAAGLSGRGLRFGRRFDELVYVEADLPTMAERKRAALARAGAAHRVAELDAFAASGAGSLTELLASLDPGRGTAILTEGLLNYFPRGAVADLWGRIAAGLAEFPTGVYLSDLNLRHGNDGVPERGFMLALGAFVRGSVHFPCDDPADAIALLEASGFAGARIHSGDEAPGAARGAARVSVLEARAG